ncbi:hypothetical protein V2S66_14010 [Streptomyces sp. V4-01]|uniref:Uncharacterized protein n=1 Tax=Actinacidiphila polyblastidii TaxID=3110430 RepID=A0ABU7PCP3_9ACTN|nr:hypothetical protein [Streptomyces sp. V4-01]
MRKATRAAEIALLEGRDEAPTALGHALRRLRAEQAGGPARVVTWASCLVSPPPGLEP